MIFVVISREISTTTEVVGLRDRVAIRVLLGAQTLQLPTSKLTKVPLINNLNVFMFTLLYNSSSE